MSTESVCAVCRIAAKQRCGGCQAVFYCTREHQIRDWKNHSKECRLCTLVESPASRPYFVATRNIKIGETVLVDKTPLVTGPWSEAIDIKGTPIPALICLGCHKRVTIDKVKFCEKCKMPLCSICTKHGGECDFMAKYRKKIVITDEKGCEPAFRAVTTVRALALRETDPESYRKLLTLEERCIGDARQPNASDNAGKLASFVKTFFNIPNFEETEIARIAAIMQMKSHMIELLDSNYTAVYDKASYIEHNCRANCSKSFTADGGIVVWAAVPISKGERISINYIYQAFGTLKRRRNLAQNHHVNCVCERCKDCTEFGTMYSAFGCVKKGCNGFLLPPSFLFANRESTRKLPSFACNKCGEKKSWGMIEKMENDIALGITMKEDVNARRRYVANAPKLLHENHFFNVSIQMYWCTAKFFVEGKPDNLSVPVLKELIDISSRLSQLFKTIAPAKNRLRGKLLFIQMQATSILHIREGSCDPTNVFEYFSTSKKLLNELHTLMHREPPTFAIDHKIAKFAAMQRQTLREIEKGTAMTF